MPHPAQKQVHVLYIKCLLVALELLVFIATQQAQCCAL
jgi:hypothetical protein